MRNTISKLTTHESRIDLKQANNGWQMAAEGDIGKHIIAKIRVIGSNGYSIPTAVIDFNDRNIDSYCTITGTDTEKTIYIDFEITDDMLSDRNNIPYSTYFRFIDIGGISNDNSQIIVEYITESDKRYYDDSGNSVRNYDKNNDVILYANWISE